MTKFSCEVRLKGLITSKIMVIEGISTQEARVQLKKDLINSMDHRNIINENATNGSNKIQFPKRIFAFDKVLICDYLTPTENYEHSLSRIQSLLSLNPSEFTSNEKIKPQEIILQRNESKKNYFILYVLIPILLAIVFKLIY